ncbi:carbohydrate ABC transporter permease [Candidatus Xianfuyuplasma coldseepsis]|uniref:Carbohydrate ABC transporter permease n=1 Tax=Candidatus Xianfuyuplasma coldseepsis TaxID=2782163 RepID=A0A7L7KQ86_9MOLU|nr:carbohydrate ABC transporter permease [Xianfuyuplasma coldseepsis]QMS84432.1 carbohydrate ABC transporter permease [Xianfuyuplasma coldseepsis]
MSLQGTQINPKRFHRSQLKFYLILIPIAAVMMLPILYIFSQALKPLDELMLFPPRFLVQKPTLRNLEMLVRTATETGIPLTVYLFNSVVVASVAITLNLTMTMLAGYALSKKHFKGRDTIFKINQAALMFVPIAVAIPTFLVIVNANILDTYIAHILPLLAMPVGVFLIKQFIDQLPNEIIEAARIDGATDLHIIRKIVVPLTKPALATVAILTFQATWSNLITSQFYINTDVKKTFAFYMSTLTSTVEFSVAGQGLAAAAGLIMFIPNLVIFIVMQSNVMDTMSHSGVK